MTGRFPNAKTFESQKQIILLRNKSSMTRTQFAEYFSIPYRTVQDWELANRKCPEYLINLMEYKLKHEGLI
jgi:DNA-binding transcriptional regulator YiaG